MSYYDHIIGDAADIPNIQHAVAPSSPEYTVSDQSSLNAALSAASPGQIIVLQDGSYGNWNASKNNGTNTKIRIIAQNVHGAVFTNIQPTGTLTGVILENIQVTGEIDTRDGSVGNVDIVGCDLGYLYLRYLIGPISVRHTVIDRNYNGQCFNGSDSPTSVEFLNCIFARAGRTTLDIGSSDTFQYQGVDDLTVKNCAFWGHSVLDGPDDPHPDLVQITNNTNNAYNSITFQKNIFYGGRIEGSGLKGAQGLFISNYAYRNVLIEENLICDTGLARRLSLNSAPASGNIIRNNTVMGNIYGEAKNAAGDNSGTTVSGNFCRLIADEAGTGWGSKVGNLEIGANTLTNYLVNSTGEGSSWRDYLPVSGGGAEGYGATTLLAELQGQTPPTPSGNLLITVRLA